MPKEINDSILSYYFVPTECTWLRATMNAAAEYSQARWYDIHKHTIARTAAVAIPIIALVNIPRFGLSCVLCTVVAVIKLDDNKFREAFEEGKNTLKCVSLVCISLAMDVAVIVATFGFQGHRILKQFEIPAQNVNEEKVIEKPVNKDIDDKEDPLPALKERIKELKGKLQAALEDIEAIKNSKEEIEENLEQTKKELEEATRISHADLEKKKKEIEDLEKNIYTLQEQFNTLSKEKNALQEALDKAKEENQQLVKEKADLETQDKTKTEQIGKLNKSLTGKEKELDEALAGKNLHITQLEAEIQKYKTQLEQQKENIKKLQESEENHQAIIKDLEEKAQKAREVAEKKLQEKTAELVNLKKQSEEQQQLLLQAQQKLYSDLQKAQKDVQDKDDLLKDTLAKLAVMTEDYKRLDGIKESLQFKLDGFEAEKKGLEEKLHLAQELAQKNKEQYEAARETFKKLSTDNQHFEAKIRHLENELNKQQEQFVINQEEKEIQTLLSNVLIENMRIPSPPPPPPPALAPASIPAPTPQRPGTTDIHQVQLRSRARDKQFVWKGDRMPNPITWDKARVKCEIERLHEANQHLERIQTILTSAIEKHEKNEKQNLDAILDEMKVVPVAGTEKDDDWETDVEYFDLSQNDVLESLFLRLQRVQNPDRFFEYSLDWCKKRKVTIANSLVYLREEFSDEKIKHHADQAFLDRQKRDAEEFKDVEAQRARQKQEKDAINEQRNALWQGLDDNCKTELSTRHKIVGTPQKAPERLTLTMLQNYYKEKGMDY